MPYLIGVPSVLTGGPRRIRTYNLASFEEVASADCASGPLDQRYRSRSRKGVVWAVGFEPTTSRFQGEDSGLTELRPEVGGRGSVFMGAIL